MPISRTLSSPLERALALGGPVSNDEVEDEHEAEKEASSPESWSAIESPDGQEDDPLSAPHEVHWSATLADASRGVKDTTHTDYMRLSERFEKWSKDGDFIAKGVDVFGESDTTELMPQLICLWIMSQADDVNINGTYKPSSEKRISYSYAMRMRAALTYRFGRAPTRGNLDWHQDETGKWKGNPSLSLQVSRYMVSLRRRKGGDAAMSSRAITKSVLRDLYDFNRPEYWELQSVSSQGSRASAAAGPRMRRLLHAAYTIAFWCLLRFDEVLGIRLEDLHDLEGGLAIELTLPRRKTEQFGGIKPFRMYMRPPEEAFLCPVRALGCWLSEYKATKGYLFPAFASRDRPRISERAMSSATFLRLFRRNLLEIGRDPTPYGTHSFRRGGCQFLATELRWPLRRICDWGGWSMNLTHMTIVKYLISWNDDPLEPREQYLNPNRPLAVKCYTCGQSCHCG